MGVRGDKRPAPIAPGRGRNRPLCPGVHLPRKAAFAASAADLPSGIAARGSYIGGDGFQGRFTTGWFGRRSHVALMVAGYPLNPGNSLGLEVRLRSGAVRPPSPYTGANPRETWRPWRVLVAGGRRGISNPLAVDGSLPVLRLAGGESALQARDWRLALTSPGRPIAACFHRAGDAPDRPGFGPDGVYFRPVRLRPLAGSGGSVPWREK